MAERGEHLFAGPALSRQLSSLVSFEGKALAPTAHIANVWIRAKFGLHADYMNAIQTLTKDQLDALLSEGEFPESVRLAAPKVVVIMTQDWCGQWANMKAYLPDFAD